MALEDATFKFTRIGYASTIAPKYGTRNFNQPQMGCQSGCSQPIPNNISTGDYDAMKPSYSQRRVQTFFPQRPKGAMVNDWRWGMPGLETLEI